MSRLPCILVILLAVNTSAAKPSVAVLDIQGTGVDPSLLPTLTEVLTVEVDNLGFYKVIAGRDVQAMLGFEEQKDVVGCTDAACLAEIGGALGVERIVASHIGKVGSTYVVNIKLINIRMADTEARAYETVRDEVDALIETIKRSVTKLLGADSDAAKAAGVAAPKPAPEPAPKPEPTPKPEPKAESKPAPKPKSKVAMKAEPKTAATVDTSGPPIVPIVLAGAGVAGLGVGTLFGMRAKGFEEDANERLPDSNAYVVGSQAAAEKAKRSALIANISLGAGLVLVGTGAVLFFVGGSSDSGTTAMVPVVGPDHVGVAIAGEL